MKKYVDNDFNFRSPNNNSILNAKKKDDSNSNKGFWKPIDQSKCELEGPYECPWCGGHVMLDATYLDQVELRAKCPYCDRFVYTYAEED